MKTLIAFVVCICVHQLALADAECDPNGKPNKHGRSYPDCMADDWDRDVLKKEKEIKEARALAREIVKKQNKPKQSAQFNNAFMEECESLTMNRKLCTELYEERFGTE